tara:strand:- start:233 stop:361 length:129 start_codon:yes stop_codon:yes gene_type:complete
MHFTDGYDECMEIFKEVNDNAPFSENKVSDSELIKICEEYRK